MTTNISMMMKTDYLVGLSPEYWCHVPLNVIDVQNLLLIDGINYIGFSDENNNNSTITTNNEVDVDTNDEKELLFQTLKRNCGGSLRPISKCLLVGCIVYVERRRDGSIAYVIDDGTGLIDCVHWSPTNEIDNDDDIFNLPSLLFDNHEGTTRNGNYTSFLIQGRNQRKTNEFEVGDQVRVFGKIDCLAASSGSSSPSSSSSSPAATVVREIHASIIENIGQVNSGAVFKSNALSEEAHHWLKCCPKSNRVDDPKLRDSSAPTTDSIVPSCHDDPLTRPIYSSHKGSASNKQETTVGIIPILEALGSDIRSQIFDKANLPASNDKVGYWRVFGPSCQCQSSYKDELLYCHCQATFEPSDPTFVFRDAVLLKLLRMEQLEQRRDEDQEKAGREEESKGDESPSSTSPSACGKRRRSDICDSSEDGVWKQPNSNVKDPRQSPKKKSTIRRRHLVFPYRAIKDDEELQRLANDQIRNNDKMNKTVQGTKTNNKFDLEAARRKLFVATFSALRKDGIISLLNSTTDEYMLISRCGVLEPYLESLETDYSKRRKNFINFEKDKSKPRYLAKVPNERLFLVKRLLALNETTSQKH